MIQTLFCKIHHRIYAYLYHLRAINTRVNVIYSVFEKLNINYTHFEKCTEYRVCFLKCSFVYIRTCIVKPSVSHLLPPGANNSQLSIIGHKFLRSNFTISSCGQLVLTSKFQFSSLTYEYVYEWLTCIWRNLIMHLTLHLYISALNYQFSNDTHSVQYPSTS